MANVPLQYPPKSGDIVICEFPECFVVPEMVKTRAVVVISKRSQHAAGTATVVPLSNTAPDPVQPHHCCVPQRLLPRFMQANGGDRWIKGDMVYTLALKRLSLPRSARNKQTGKRVYDTARLDLQHLLMVRRCVASALVIDPDIFVQNQNDMPRIGQVAVPLPKVKPA